MDGEDERMRKYDVWPCGRFWEINGYEERVDVCTNIELCGEAWPLPARSLWICGGRWVAQVKACTWNVMERLPRHISGVFGCIRWIMAA